MPQPGEYLAFAYHVLCDAHDKRICVDAERPFGSEVALCTRHSQDVMMALTQALRLTAPQEIAECVRTLRQMGPVAQAVVKTTYDLWTQELAKSQPDWYRCWVKEAQRRKVL